MSFKFVVVWDIDINCWSVGVLIVGGEEINTLSNEG